MKNSSRYVLSGGMCVGKTTTLTILKEQFNVFPDHAREFMQKKGLNSKQIDRDALQRVLFHQRSKDFLSAKEISFFDEGIPDGFAYYIMDGLEVPQDLWNKAKKMKYDKIFFLDPLDFYETDKIRKESFEEREVLRKALLEVYRKLNYNPIMVPFMSIRDRVEFIKNKIQASSES